MVINRRHMLLGSLSGAALFATPLRAAPLASQGLDAGQFGVKANASEDQTQRLQRAIDQAARAQMPLWLAPGVYRAGGLKLSAGSQLAGVRGATRILLTRGPSLLSAQGADRISLSGLSLDGDNMALEANRGLVHLTAAKGLRIVDCTIDGAGGNGIGLTQCSGEVTGNTITGAADTALYCIDNAGLTIGGNRIAKSGNGGIRVWQSVKRHDGSVISDNRIDDTEARAGGSGQNGNAINVFRAGDVIVRGNIIRRAAFSAIRGNGASNFLVTGNNCAEFGETAMYAEFGYEGAIFSDNVIDGAANGIAVTNFNDGGRYASVHGNLVRNIGLRETASLLNGSGNGFGISVEADIAVSGNVIETAAYAGLRLGFGPYLRNVAATGNVVRNSSYGIVVSVVRDAGGAAISGNLIQGAKRGAIVGMEWHKAVTGDLAVTGAERYPQLRVTGNQVM